MHRGFSLARRSKLLICVSFLTEFVFARFCPTFARLCQVFLDFGLIFLPERPAGAFLRDYNAPGLNSIRF